jgi:hypothetical protein
MALGTGTGGGFTEVGLFLNDGVQGGLNEFSSLPDDHGFGEIEDLPVRCVFGGGLGFSAEDEGVFENEAF